jgi:hypothetical protein
LAEDYLARFPNGPYAKAAKAVLGEGTATSGVGEADDALSGE